MQRQPRCLVEEDPLCPHPRVYSAAESRKTAAYVRPPTARSTAGFWRPCCRPAAGTTPSMSAPACAAPLSPWRCCTGMSQRGRSRCAAPASPVRPNTKQNQASGACFLGGCQPSRATFPNTPDVHFRSHSGRIGEPSCSLLTTLTTATPESKGRWHPHPLSLLVNNFRGPKLAGHRSGSVGHQVWTERTLLQHAAVAQPRRVYGCREAPVRRPFSCPAGEAWAVQGTVRQEGRAAWEASVAETWWRWESRAYAHWREGAGRLFQAVATASMMILR